MKSIRDFAVKGKRVLVRVDFNVPLDAQGNILDDFRIKETIPTIEYLIKKRAKIILLTHLGRPKGRVVRNLKLDRVQEKLMEYLDLSITKAPDCIGKIIEKYTQEMREGEILLLENLRFHQEEENRDLKFAKSLAKLGEIYINDAFGASHRAHTSIVLLPKYLPSGIGFLLEKEIENLNKLLKAPKRPMITIIGGKKVETKAKLIEKILKISDFLLIGTLIDKEIKEKKIKLEYPEKIIRPLDSIIDKRKKLDIGPKTIKVFKEKILKGRTIFWNGPLGKIEDEKYSKGTFEIVKAIIKSRGFLVAGGGETVEFLNRYNLIRKFSHVSTGGGAMLEFLSGKKLPGIEVLE